MLFRSGIMGRIYVRYRDAKADKELGSWVYPAEWNGLANDQTLTMPGLVRGGTYCFEARSQEAGGTSSGWTAPSCTVIAADDRALSATSSWHRVTGSGYFLSTATVSSSPAGYLSTATRATAIWIVAKTCPSCGEVGVKNAGRTVWMSLTSATTRNEAVLRVPLAGPINGTVEFVARSNGRLVTIDGFASLDD